MAYVALVIGAKGQGKSTFIKNMIEAKPNYIFDVQNEYQDYNPAPHLDRNLFIQECLSYTDTFCVLEEATGFFKGALSANTDRMILGARHTNNRYIFCFHSIRAVPPGIMAMVNFVVLFKTLDEPNEIKRKYYRLLNPYMQLQKMKQYSKIIIKMI